MSSSRARAGSGGSGRGCRIDLVAGRSGLSLASGAADRRTLRWLEGRLRDVGLDGYGGGVLLFVLLAGLWLVGTRRDRRARAGRSRRLRPGWSTSFLLYSLLALGDLLHHVWRIESAVRADDIERARRAVSALVGRDTDRMDGAACRRAAVESLSENLTDGFVSPVFWYVARRTARPRPVQGRQHDGLDGRLQDAASISGSAGAARGSTT